MALADLHAEEVGQKIKAACEVDRFTLFPGSHLAGMNRQTFKNCLKVGEEKVRVFGDDEKVWDSLQSLPNGGDDQELWFLDEMEPPQVSQWLTAIGAPEKFTKEFAWVHGRIIVKAFEAPALSTCKFKHLQFTFTMLRFEDFFFHEFINKMLVTQAGQRYGFPKENQDGYLDLQVGSCRFIGVFDGHGAEGKTIVDKVKATLPLYLKPGEFEDIIPEALEALCEELESLSACQNSGTTFCGVLLDKKKVAVVNVGDSECVLFRQSQGIRPKAQYVWKVVNRLHALSDPQEAARIHKLGYPVFDKRLQSGINITRSLGDHESREYGLMDTPDLYVLDTKKWDYLLLGSDGLFDHTPLDEIANIVFSDKPEKHKQIVKLAQAHWNRKGWYCDDITVLLVPI